MNTEVYERFEILESYVDFLSQKIEDLEEYIECRLEGGAVEFEGVIK